MGPRKNPKTQIAYMSRTALYVSPISIQLKTSIANDLLNKCYGNQVPVTDIESIISIPMIPVGYIQECLDLKFN
jgi:hypothetical protein